jgi:hypothetical protein
MIRDITIGQYFPGKSAIHKMDPRIKILLSILYIVMLFVADNMWGLLLGVLFGFAAYLISRIPLSMIWKSMKPVVPIVIFTAVLNLFLSTGDPLWQWKFLKITREGIETAVFMSVRILCLIAGTSLLTYTTSPIALTDGIERLLSPLKKIKLPVHELAMMMTIAPPFTPMSCLVSCRSSVTGKPLPPRSEAARFVRWLPHPSCRPAKTVMPMTATTASTMASFLVLRQFFLRRRLRRASSNSVSSLTVPPPFARRIPAPDKARRRRLFCRLFPGPHCAGWP